MAGALFRIGERTIAQHFVEQALANSRRLDAPMALALSLWGAGMSALAQGNLQVAHQYAKESLALSRQIGDKHHINMGASGSADILRQMGNMREAEKLYAEAIRGWWDYGQFGGMARCIERPAFIAIDEKRDKRAGRWLGTAEMIRETSRAEMIPPEQEEYQREVAILRGRMSPDDFASAWSEGQAPPYSRFSLR